MSDGDLGAALGGTAVGGILIDVLIHSGDLIATLLLFVVSQADLLVPLLSHMTTLASAIAWIPEDLVNKLFLAAVGLLVAVYVARLLNRAWRQFND